MALVEDVRRPKPIVKAWYSYGSPNPACMEVRKDRYIEWNKIYEKVISERGKRRYIQVGSKRRQAFNYFYRYKSEDLAKDVWYVCAPAVNRWGEKYITEFWRQSHKSYPVLSPGPFSNGDPCPFMHTPSIDYWARREREVIERDLFVKANAPLFEGAVFLAELTETIASLRSILVGAARGIAKASSRKKQLKHLVLHPEELWLWYRYFLLPAMMDAEDIMRAVKGSVRIDRVQDGIKGTPRIMTGSNQWVSPSMGTTTVNWTSKYEVSGGGAIDLSMRHDPHEWGTSAWDILRAGWEIIPFSFVFDWFIEVGDWLASLREIDLEIAQSYATIAVEAETTIDVSNWSNIGDDFLWKTFWMERVVDLEPPSTPHIDRNKLSLLRQIDAASLTLGILRGIFTTRRK